MFTGLVADRGRVRSAEPDPAGAGLRLAIETRLAADLAPGDSVAVNGACLTAESVEWGGFAAAVLAETARRTSLAALDPADEVNLELPVRAGEPLGGHFVLGHVDGVGEVERVEPEGSARVVRVCAPPELLRYVVEKGSVAVDGVSLTVAAVDGGGFTVSLVDETLARTTLGTAAPGRFVNLEADVLAKHVEKLLPAARSGAQAENAVGSARPAAEASA
jgi:riboflavin synthase